jgi:hypothetical protein
MCSKAQGWKCQAAVTNFLSTVLFSIVKGEDCDYVDTLQLSDCELFKVRTEGKPKCDRKGTTAEAGAIQVTGGGSELREGEDDADSVSVSEGAEAQKAMAEKANGEGLSRSARQASKREGKKTNPWAWPGVRRLFKEWTEDQLVNFVTECLTIISEGGFWLLPHAHSEFAENQMRGSNEQRESVLMFEVFKFVATKLAEERKDDAADGWNYQNFYTNKKNVTQVKAVFSNPTGSKCLWIKVDPNLCGLGLGYSTTNISIHLSKLRVDVDTTDLALFDEEITKVQKMFMDVIHFVCSLEGKEVFASGDQNGITSSREGAVGKQGRTETCKTEKRRSEGISDVIDVETSALQDIGGGSPALLGVTRSKTSEKEARLLPSSEECVAFRRSIFAKDSSTLVLVVNRAYVPYGASKKSETFPSSRLFAVISTEDSCGKKLPCVVFPCLPKVERGRILKKVFFGLKEAQSREQLLIYWSRKQF